MTQTPSGYPRGPIAEARHQRAIELAGGQSARWLGLIDGLANAVGAGLLLDVYRDTFLRIPAALASAVLMRRALDSLYDAVRARIEPVLVDSAEAAISYATDIASLYPTLAHRGRPRYSRTLVTLALDAVLALVSAQRAGILSMIASGRATPDALIGTDRRPGILNPTPILAEASDQIVAVGHGALIEGLTTIGMTAPQNGLHLQAIAAIDERTTPCCLAIHAHAVPISGGRFHLTAAPHYADYMANPPFHRWCRTAVAVVTEADLAGRLTMQMRAAADAEIAARAAHRPTRRTAFIGPTHARSRRGQ